MPYVNKETREKLLGRPPLTTGELNYAITKLCHEYLLRAYTGEFNYGKISSVLGVLSDARDELYRQVAVPYEDRKKAENGSISELDK